MTESTRLRLTPTTATPSSAKACCDTSPQHTAGTDAPVVALVGAPNTGKSTLFNALTGSRVTMGNWPGTTVEVSRGVWRTTLATPSCDSEKCTSAHDGDPLAITLMDLPGAYSLDAHSPDEQLTRGLLKDGPVDERQERPCPTPRGARVTKRRQRGRTSARIWRDPCSD